MVGIRPTVCALIGGQFHEETKNCADLATGKDPCQICTGSERHQ